MSGNPRVHFIPPKPPKRERRVGIYCRVSSNSSEQLKSLSAQVSALTRLTAATPQWLLVDVYMDIASSKSGSSRKEFDRMLQECKSRNLDIILTKSISRFGRDTVDTLEALNQLKTLGVRVIFEQEDLDTANTDSELMISIIEAIAQAENESRSDNIKWGIKQRAAQGTSKLYNRKCYGYKNDVDGSLIIDDEEAKNVQLIFDLYLQGKSIIGIIEELERLEIKSPTGKDKWSKRTIDVMLSNEKYIGIVRLLNSGKNEVHYVSENNNPPIIIGEMFKAIQIEKASRSNVVKDGNEKKRKGTKYSSKKCKE
ncbi:recombinase family protein [Tindallia californiensis]|uniref:Site-specific DNA recombinase n=1 Tax=Tindallia californiensis TaxID=159292 RepID=A0A1H3K1G8_9FIRM|nr:recombinase family protein [Tindallia californiensis]SDY45438.1 Site-specific DNA recombinase [Tindallia californiensis]